MVVTSSPAKTFNLFAAMIEGRTLAHHGLHTADPGREFRALDVQFDIGRKLAMVAVAAQVVGT